MEPFVLSLFWNQVEDEKATIALLLIKWWARLRFVIGGSRSSIVKSY